MSSAHELPLDLVSNPSNAPNSRPEKLQVLIYSEPLVGLILLCIHDFGVPFVRGFNCNDETIRYPHKDSTVSSAVCYSVGSALNILLIILIELMNLRANRDQANNPESTSGENDKLCWKTYAKNIYCRLLVWFFGAITSELFTDIAKFTAGRLRPHFIAVCQPKVGGLDIDEYCERPHAAHQYITDYRCSGNPDKLRDIRLSFLSGHSSYSAYSATFAVLLIQNSVDVNKFGLLKPAVQVLISATAFYTGLTRISDYKHHWQDVLAGLLLGTLVATLFATCVWHSFYETYTRYWQSKPKKQTDAGDCELNRLSD